MRIVHVIGGYLPQDTGGTQIHVRDLARGQRARGHQVEIFTRVAGREQGELEIRHGKWDGVPVTSITNNFDDVDRFERLYTHPTIDARFDEFVRERRPDLVHVHHLTCLSTSMIEVARERAIPVVMGLHDYWMMCLRGQRIRPEELDICETLDRERCLACLNRLWPHLLPIGGPRSLIEWLRRRPPSLRKLHAWEAHIRRMLVSCQALTAPSRFHRDRFVEWGVDPSRLFVAPYGLTHDHFHVPAITKPRLRHIGYIGSVIPSKGVHTLCEAFAQINRKDLVLHIHGEVLGFHGDTGYGDRLRAIIGPHLDVRFHGRYEHAELPAILTGLDVLVVPSLWWESFCLTAREGALAGLPVVASRLGALEEAVADGIAIGFRPGDSDDLARVLLDLIDTARSPPSADALASVLTLESSILRMEEIYRSAIGGGRPAGASDGR